MSCFSYLKQPAITFYGRPDVVKAPAAGGWRGRRRQSQFPPSLWLINRISSSRDTEKDRAVLFSGDLEASMSPPTSVQRPITLWVLLRRLVSSPLLRGGRRWPPGHCRGRTGKIFSFAKVYLLTLIKHCFRPVGCCIVHLRECPPRDRKPEPGPGRRLLDYSRR